MGIAILAKIRLRNFGHRPPFHMPRDICLQNPTHVYVAERGGSPPNLEDAKNMIVVPGNWDFS